MNAEFYVIRHKASGLVMPQAKKNRGYSHWNPSLAGNVFEAALDTPRLLITLTSAIRCISQWAACPNGRYTEVQSSYDGDYDGRVNFKDDGRKKDDLEVIKVVLVEPS